MDLEGIGFNAGNWVDQAGPQGSISHAVSLIQIKNASLEDINIPFVDHGNVSFCTEFGLQICVMGKKKLYT